MSGTIEARNGARYRAVFQVIGVPKMLVTADVAKGKIEEAGLTGVRVWLEATDLPADWPRTAIYADTDATWYVYAEGVWSGASGSYPQPDAIVKIWEVVTDATPPTVTPVPPPTVTPVPPPTITPATPPFVPPASPPPASPPPASPPASSLPARAYWAICAGFFAVGGIVTVLVLAADSDDGDRAT
jgi:hypothetical protein